jgi:hypothetical protein
MRKFSCARCLPAPYPLQTIYGLHGPTPQCTPAWLALTGSRRIATVQCQSDTTVVEGEHEAFARLSWADAVAQGRSRSVVKASLNSRMKPALASRPIYIKINLR